MSGEAERGGRPPDAAELPSRRPVHGPGGLLGPRLLALFLGGCLLFGYPFLELFSRQSTVAGVPLLYVYLFTAWGLFIVLIAWLVEGERKRR
ncbi:MAG: hypothetical protein MI919_01885 [Holophagales bacterium]|nr:hypothetical protein [Holophagales bacterium]